jgi:hypothetical protein
MSVTQTVEIPANHRLTIDVPREVPAGPTVLTFTPAKKAADLRSEDQRPRMTEAEEMEYINRNAERLNREALDVLSYQNLDALRENHERWDPSEIARSKTIVPFNWGDIKKE